MNRFGMKEHTEHTTYSIYLHKNINIKQAHTLSEDNNNDGEFERTDVKRYIDLILAVYQKSVFSENNNIEYEDSEFGDKNEDFS